MASTPNDIQVQNIPLLGDIADGDKLLGERVAGTTVRFNYSTTANGIVNTGLINQLAYYAAAGNTLSGVAIVNSAALLSSAGGVPTWTAYTGTGSPVLNNGPTLIAPVLGTPASGNLSLCTAYPLANLTGAGTGVLTSLAAAVSGSGGSVCATGATLSGATFTGSTALGTPASGTLTNCTIPISGISSLGTDVATALAANYNGSGAISGTTSPTFVTPVLGAATATSINGLAITTSTGTFTLANSKTLSCSNTLTFTGTDGSSVAFGAGGTVLYSGGALGTPSSGTLSSCSGYAMSSLTGLASGIATFLGTPSSANLASALTDKTGTGSNVFATSPTITTPNIVGLTSGSFPAAGSVGEKISATVLQGSAVSLSTGAAKTIMSISLTAGVWYIFGNLQYTISVSATVLAIGINTTTNAFPSTEQYSLFGIPGGIGNTGLSAPGQILSISGTTNYFLVGLATFATGTVVSYGQLMAYRIA